jgi:hypothetical protein
LLVPKHARDAHAGNRCGFRRGIGHARGDDPRKQAARNLEGGQQVLVPIETAQIHELSPARVGHVGQMRAARGTAGEIPQQPGIDRPEQDLAARGGAAQPRHLIEQPAKFQCAEIAGERQAGLGAEAVLPFLAAIVRHQPFRPRVLPDQSVMKRRSAAAVPDDGRFALIRDAERGDVAGLKPRLRQTV